MGWEASLLGLPRGAGNVASIIARHTTHIVVTCGIVGVGYNVVGCGGCDVIIQGNSSVVDA